MATGGRDGATATAGASVALYEAGWRGWARPFGLAVVLVNRALIALNLLAGELAGRVLLWAIGPLIIAGYLLGLAGRRALGAGQA